MKGKFILMLTLFTLFCQAQTTKKIIEEKDIERFGNNVSLRNIKVEFLNADEKLIPIKLVLSCPSDVYLSENITPIILMKMATISHDKAMYICKNKYSFGGKKITLNFIENENVWNVTTTFIAQNSYGGVQESFVSVYFDSTGKKEMSIEDVISRDKEKQQFKNEMKPQKFDD